MFGQTALPMHGSVRIVKVDGKYVPIRGNQINKYVPIRDNEIKSHCIELRGLGKTIVSFSS